MRPLPVFLLICAVLGLGGCGEAARLDSLASQGKAKVVEVVTGDMVRTDAGETIKLAGITAPRLDDPYGEASRERLAEMVLGQQVELLAAGAATDPFGRRVAQLRLAKGRRWVQGRMLQEGAARVRTFPESRALASMMLDREAQARNRGRGLWTLLDYRVMIPAEAVKAAPGFALVEGQVLKVHTGADARLLDLGHGFTVRIPARAIQDFDSAGRSPAALEGQLVRVRGSIGRGGDMRLDHPEGVEILKAR
ncbi:MAG: thermonuclease family protein [Caulobacter sp.]|nr:thermonuclease family protein [Caulobacter sp.]